LRTAEEAAQYLTRLRQLLRWLDISEGDMEKGHLRCDGTVSIRPKGAEFFNPKTEIKNVNSIIALRDAVQAEIDRQTRQVEAGKAIEAWTLEWDEDAGVLRKMRSKESEADYRYFREPDLLPIRIDDDWRGVIFEQLPELPLERRARFVEQYELPDYDADILTSERGLSDYYEDAVRFYEGDPKRVSNWLMNDVLRLINERGVEAGRLQISPKYLVEIIQLVDAGLINTSTGKSLIEKVEDTGSPPAEIVNSDGLAKVSDEDAIRAVCAEVLAENPDQVASYQGGKATLIGWFVGQVMKKSRGKADPQLAKMLLEELLSKT
jgi:aspartyl-tRNA(Asn)/glutamyl-tRNA(Gln) amidotransferase subunit B